MSKNYLLLSFVLLLTTASAQVVTIPDYQLRNALLNYSPAIDTNSDGQIQLTEAQAVTSLTITNFNEPDTINSLTGLEAFTNLVYLDISSIGLYAGFSMAPFTQLEYFDCSNNYVGAFSNVAALSALKTLKCNHANVPDLANLINLPNLEYVSASYASGTATINASNLPNLTYLDCSTMGLTSLNVANSGLVTLNCKGNPLTSLNLSTVADTLTDLNCAANTTLVTTPALGNLTNLQALDCSYNGLTNLNLTNLVNLTKLNCMSNQIEDLNTANLQNMLEFNCSYNPLGSLTVATMPNLQKLYCNDTDLISLSVNSLVNLTDLSCRLNQIPSLEISQLVNLKTLDIGYNGMSAIDISPLTQLVGFACDANSLTTVNLLNAPMLQSLSCNYNLLTTLDVSNNPYLTLVDCSHNQFTTLDFSPIIGNGSGSGYTQFWISGNPQLEYVNFKCGRTVTLNVSQNALECPNLEYVCVDEPNINSIKGALYNGGAPNIEVNSYCSFLPGGNYNTITGTISLDANADGCDTADPDLPAVKVNLTLGFNTVSTFTNALGDYTFFVPTGNFTVTPLPELPYYNLTPTSATIGFPTIDESTQTQSFCMVPNGIHKDLEVTILPVVPANPGFDAMYKLVYRNKGNQPISGSIGFIYNDSVLDFVSSAPASTSQSAGLLNWDFTTLAPQESRTIDIILNVNSPQEIPAVNIGDVLHFMASASPMADDETPLDNTCNYTETVIGSFDPNDKTCLEGPTITPSMVGDYLHYLIRFQNTGTAPAQNIVVKDVIDTLRFDLASFQLTASSHPQVTRIIGNRVDFVFEGINLPGEDNEPQSHGFVAFKIKTKDFLTLGETVSNKAEIYFDFNFPIVTNTTSTTVSNLGVGEVDDLSVSIAPNPVKNILTISAQNDITSVQLFDIHGRLLQTVLENDNSATLDFTGKATGVYFVKVITDNGMKVQKVIKE